MNGSIGRALATVVLVVTATSTSAQTARRLTTLDGLRRFSGYFHLQSVILRGEFVEADGRTSLRSGSTEMRVLLGSATAVDGPVEIRAELIDVGRLTPSDPRLAADDHRPDPDHWPAPGEDLVLNVASVTKPDPVSSPTVRGLALEPWRFEGQSVTVTGQFGGRNLLGDLPAAPAKGQYDFVLRGAEGAVWITGLRPRGKGFDLNVDARVDTSHWVQVTGVVTRERGMVLIQARTILPAQAPAARVVLDEPPPPPKVPGQVVFSSPTDGETGVSATGAIRVQFSRGIDPPSLTGRLRLSSVGGAAPAADAAALDLQVSYDAGTRAVVVKLSKPLEPYRTVKLELLDGVRTFDNAPVTPWSVTFTVGAQ